MSVFRLAIIASCVVAVLPADKTQQARLYDGAVGAAEWAATYCDREAQNCEKASVYWDQFKTKAQFAATMAVDTVQRYSAEAAKASPEARSLTSDVMIEQVAVRHVPIPAPVPVNVPKVVGRGTLIEDDLRAPWRGAKPNKS